jgi:hypothetical protein
MPANQLTFENNIFINTRYAFELKGTDTRVFDIHKNYYKFEDVIGALRVQDADKTNTQGTFSAEYTGINVIVTPIQSNTEVKAGVDPTYTIVIPASVDFGSLQKIDPPNNFVSEEFKVTASGVVIEAGAQIDVSVTSCTAMNDGHGHELPYSLYNEGGTSPITNGVYASFDGSVADNVGRVTVDTSNIHYAGDYSGTMVFTITYVDAA